MIKKLFQQSGVWLAVLFIFYAVLSWILLFRDKRALTGISHFYPQLHSFLFSTQTLLLHHNLNTIPTFLFAIFAALACYFYFSSLKQNITLRKTIVYALIFGVILFFSYPILSTDIFSYIFSDRIATVYHQNVYTTIPLTHNSDPFAYIADWKNTTKVYGEVNQLIYDVPSVLGVNNLVLLVAMYKLVSSIFTIGIFYVLYLIMKSEKNGKTLARDMRLLLWNPLFLLELFGSGHNDSIMLFFTLFAYYFYHKKSYLLAGMLLAFAVQIKLIPVLLFIFILVSLLQKKFFKNAAYFVLSFVLINIFSFALMGVSPLSFAERVSYNAGVYWQSLPNLTRYLYPHSNYVFTASFFIVLCWLIVYQIRTKQNPLLLYAYSLSVYLLFFATAYWDWYVLWILALIPILRNTKFRYFAITFSFTSLLAYPFYWFSLRFNYQNIIWPIVIYLFVFIIPVVVYFISSKKVFAKQVVLFD